MSESIVAVFHGAGKPLEMCRVPLPEPARGATLVRLLGCTLCGSDLHTFDGRRNPPLPTVLGHELVGRIVAFGDNTPRRDLAGCELNVGDRVTWSIVAHCGECFFCRRRLPQKCLKATKYGHQRFVPGDELLGGVAEFCLLVPGTSIVRLPESLPLSVACPASCATATVTAALSAIGEVADCCVCVLGAGLLGLTACAMLSVAGAAEIVCVDINRDRLALAKRYGATRVASPEELAESASAVNNGYGFDAAFELCGNNAAFEAGLEHLRLGGQLALVGAVFPTAPVAVTPEQLVRRNLTIHGIHNYAPEHLLRAVDFLANHHHKFPFSEVVTDWLPLEAAETAFQLARDPNRIRVGIRPQAAVTGD